MTDTPTHLDTHRSPESQIEVEVRRYDSPICRPHTLAWAPVRDEAKRSQRLTSPADSWRNIARKAIFLLDRYAAVSEAQDMRVQVQIKRALCYTARLTRRKERKP